MPKTKNTKKRPTKLRQTKKPTELRDPLYTYVSITNGNWVRQQAVKSRQSYSLYLNKLLDRARARAA